MPFNLFALCQTQNSLETRRIRLNAALQNEIENIFTRQANVFEANITQEIPFTGDWKPDRDQVLTIDLPDEAQVINETLTNNANAIPVLDLNNFENEPIKALFGSSNNRILLQLFSKKQFLNRCFSLFLDNDTYNKLEAPTICFDNKLLCIIENNVIKFKSFHNLRCVFNLSQLYVEATDEDIEAFSELENLAISDVEIFKSLATQNIRKRIHNLLKSDVLRGFTVQEIQQKALDEGITNLVNVDDNNKIVVPEDRQAIGNLLSFFDDKLYRGVFSGDIIQASSTQVVPMT